MSVVIASYNRPVMLLRAIKSVAEQTYRNLEVIVSDDCSDFDVSSVIEKCQRDYPFLRILLHRNSCNMGAPFTRNAGINLATGFFVTGLDDDDEFKTDRVEQFIRNYDSKCSFLASNAELVGRKKTRNLFACINQYDHSDLLWGNRIGNQIFVERARILGVGGFDESLTSSQDIDLWYRLAMKFGKIGVVHNNSYILHTEHDEKRITTSTNKIDGMKKFIEKHKNQMNFFQKQYLLFRVSVYEKKYLKSILTLSLFFALPGILINLRSRFVPCFLKF